MNAAYLWAQLEEADKINDKRLSIWNFYHEELKELEDKGVLERPYIPEYATHNAHMYYIKVKDLRVRTKLLAYLKERGILSVFHYVPLHSATAGKKFGRFHGRGCLHDKRERTAVSFADVLQSVPGRSSGSGKSAERISGV